jgi:hypothetical protein
MLLPSRSANEGLSEFLSKNKSKGKDPHLADLFLWIKIRRLDQGCLHCQQLRS